MKKILTILLSLILSLSLSSCSHINDTNGPDDYTIQTFSDEDYCTGFSSYVALGMFTSRSLTIDGVYKGTCDVKKLSGIYKLDEYKWEKSNYLNIEIEYDCSSGNSMIVLVSNGEIAQKINPNTISPIKIINSRSKYRILVVGESSSVKISCKISPSN